MQRREVLGVLGAGLALGAIPSAMAQTNRFDQLLAQAAADPDSLDVANGERERFLAVAGDPKGAQGNFRGSKSTRAISARAKQLLVTFEVSGQALYEKRYKKPTWPGGRSGVTVGIGYDLGYVTEKGLRDDWSMLGAESLAALAQCCGKTGEEAKSLIPLLSKVTVSWQDASKQFDAYLPYAAGQTESTFRNCGLLTDDSFGALVSLIYNRGASLSPTSARRKEMREIGKLMTDKTFTDIPAKIRDMKRLWPKDNERGLILRRETEATLFEQGMAKT